MHLFNKTPLIYNSSLLNYENADLLEESHNTWTCLGFATLIPLTLRNDSHEYSLQYPYIHQQTGNVNT